MQLRDVAGGPVQFTSRDLIAMMTSRNGLFFLFLAMMMMLLSDPPSLLAHLSWFEAAIVWVAALAMHLVSFFIVLNLLGTLQSRGTIGRIWTPMITLITITPVVSSAEMLVMALSGPEYQVVILRKIFTYFLIVQIIELAFIRFVLPQPTRDVPEEGQFFRVGERRIPVRRLRYLEAQEHYVRVVLDEETFLQRARLGDIVAQLPDEAGMQPHRSWWVSAASGPRLVRKGAKSCILLRDTTEVPVARGRSCDVVAWLDKHGPFDICDAAAE
ncbi:LytTR family DNA-binding domain-containing protein [Roseobacteraceae bacterium S113]